ncbi:MAG TPA: MarC family protein [Myxococcaceae bacterium]|jgi:multiple antibiotic resistance protein|nr:MarC family protein [Myxococcaceae bacterium]
MNDLVTFSLVALSAVFFVVDPLGVVPIFLAVTAGDSPEKMRSTARRASLTAFGLLTFFALFGTLLFKVAGISLGAFRVAGGILLLITGLDMLRARPSELKTSPEEEAEATRKEDVAIVPLAVPLLAGPGAIATVMVLMSRGKGILVAVPVLLAVSVTCIASYLILRAASLVLRVLGQSGVSILQRVMGLILAAIAVQFVAEGVRELFNLPGA